jgi:hypothetical protein
MSEANDGTTVVIVAPGEGDTPEGGGGGQVEAAGEAQVETVADAAVQIAAIEAERDVTLAIIEGENAADREERFAENINEELQRANTALRAELDECRNTIRTLETTVAQLTPPSPPEPAEPLNPPPEPAAGEVAAVPLEVETEAPAPEPEKPRRKALRWI